MFEIYERDLISVYEYSIYCKGEFICCTPDKEIAKTIKEALEKQIPKKLNIWDELTYACPTCGKSYWAHQYIGSHCSKCGQKIVRS